MQELVNAQRTFFQTNATKDINFRIEQLRKLKGIIRDNEAMLEEAIYKDIKKSVFDNFASEFSLLYVDIDEAVKKMKRWSRRKRIKTNILNFPAKSYSIPEPLGVTLVIGAWNYPYQLSLAPAIAAIAAGNTVIIKPSELPLHTSHAMAELINSNFPSSFLKVIEGGVAETTELLNQKFNKVFFTGSVPVGKIVYQAAAKNLTPVTLELGGKSPAIVCRHCNLKMAVKRLVWSKFFNAGQTCIAPDHIYVHSSIKEEFLQLMKKEIEASEFSIENGNYVQIINEKNMLRLVEMIDKDKVYMGGSYDMEKRHIEPTILQNVSNQDSIMSDEIFGPILPVFDYEEIDQVIGQINSRPKPLACYTFTKNRKIKDKILNEVSFGGGGVNEALMQVTNSHLPFGGVGDSGIGSYHGEAGFKAFSHYKSILDKPTWFELSLKYFPHSPTKLKFIKYMFGQK